MRKSVFFIIGVLLVILSVAVVMAAIGNHRRDKEIRLKMESIERTLEHNYKQIDSLYHSINYRQDTIRIIEQRQNIYTTKTINNEKVILLSSDSINDVMYKNNKRKFFNEWMQGRYTPAIYK